MENEKQLKGWLESLDRQQLEQVAFNCLEELIITEEVGYYPETSKRPYWKQSGDEII